MSLRLSASLFAQHKALRLAAWCDRFHLEPVILLFRSQSTRQSGHQHGEGFSLVGRRQQDQPQPWVPQHLKQWWIIAHLLGKVLYFLEIPRGQIYPYTAKCWLLPVILQG
ncbi:hypothetical protein AV530_015749 [Patagioenas fasciata monilis]|uniref:Uncharacterized protein n=1 Tax=Patagioenas fasciata monilis TaxID=372326 RepID=A0A1V4KIM5_PATFA|nr:hypothetical protein AV530_015749 [Patagioenas fasciata monilis]